MGLRIRSGVRSLGAVGPRVSYQPSLSLAGAPEPEQERFPSVTDTDDLVCCRLGQPYLAGTAMYLAHVPRTAGQVKDLELLGFRIEADYRVPAEVAQPDPIPLIHIHGISPRA